MKPYYKKMKTSNRVSTLLLKDYSWRLVNDYVKMAGTVNKFFHTLQIHRCLKSNKSFE